MKTKSLRDEIIKLRGVIDKEIDREMSKMPLSEQDSIRKSAYCFGLQKVLYSLDDILDKSEE